MVIRFFNSEHRELVSSLARHSARATLTTCTRALVQVSKYEKIIYTQSEAKNDTESEIKAHPANSHHHFQSLYRDNSLITEVHPTVVELYTTTHSPQC